MGRPISRWKVAAIQMTSTSDVSENLAKAERLMRRAAAAGADLIAFPENFAYLLAEGRRVLFRESLAGEVVRKFREHARRLGRHLLLGSIQEKIPRSRRVHNTSVLIDPEGEIVAIYRKMHLFDIHVPGRAVLTESRTVAPGDRTVVAETALGRLGLSICYDLRFPELYRRMALMGAQVLFVPAAFTAFTGPDHWMPLLRARAIENQCWVVAPAQVGEHGGDRRSHGETAVIDPWGAVVARRRSGEGVLAATVDLGAVERVRRGLPCLEHVRPRLLGLRRLPRG